MIFSLVRSGSSCYKEPMSNYENAPATLLLATHCAACARPLVDAVSVEAGMGPDCRKKYMKAETSPENREKANKLVHDIAMAISLKNDTVYAASKIAEVRALGFEKLADKLTKENVGIVIERENDTIVVKAPFSENALAYSRSIPGRRWDAQRKVTVFPARNQDLVRDMLRACYPGANALGPKGFFVI